MNIQIKQSAEAPLKKLWLCGLVLMGSAGVALGQTTALSANIVPELAAFKVSVAQGAEKLVSAARVMPGETIEYQVRYSNTGNGGAKNLQAVLPIPGELQYVPDSAKPSGALASLNGQTYAPMPLMRVVKAADGTSKSVAVPPAEYRFLRWNVAALGAGQTVRVSARAQLAPLPKTSPATSSAQAGKGAK